jgi:hypothetical protein
MINRDSGIGPVALIIVLFLIVVFSFFSKKLITKIEQPRTIENKTNVENSLFDIVTNDSSDSGSGFEEWIDRPDDYEVGFQAGKYALYSQMGIEYIPDEKEVFAYSSFLEENNDSKYSNNKEYDRGYVDGYHRATEKIYCPASAGHK